MRKLLLTLAVAASGLAQDNMPRTTKTEIGTGVKDATVDYFDAVSDYFRSTGRAVRAVHDKGIPAEEVPAVFLITRRSSASANQVIDARKAGKSWTEIAKSHKAEMQSEDVVAEANVAFLSSYYGTAPDAVKAMRQKGASWISIDQELRRSGGATKSRQQ